MQVVVVCSNSVLRVDPIRLIPFILLFVAPHISLLHYSFVTSFVSLLSCCFLFIIIVCRRSSTLGIRSSLLLNASILMLLYCIISSVCLLTLCIVFCPFECIFGWKSVALFPASYVQINNHQNTHLFPFLVVYSIWCCLELFHGKREWQHWYFLTTPFICNGDVCFCHASHCAPLVNSLEDSDDDYDEYPFA